MGGNHPKNVRLTVRKVSTLVKLAILTTENCAYPNSSASVDKQTLLRKIDFDKLTRLCPVLLDGILQLDGRIAEANASRFPI